MQPLLPEPLPTTTFGSCHMVSIEINDASARTQRHLVGFHH